MTDPNVERILSGGDAPSPPPDDESSRAMDRLLGGERMDESEGLLASVQEAIAQSPEVAKTALDWAKNLVTGEGRAEFDLPELGTSGPDVPAGSEEGARMMGAYALSVEPSQIADIAMKTLPGADIREDSFGNPIVTFEGKDYYVNRPGLSHADLFQLLAQTGLYAPAAKSGLAVRGLVRRALRVGSRSAATSMGADVGAQALGAEEGISLGRAGVAFGAGAGFEILAPAVKAAWRFLFQRGGMYDAAKGELTKAGRKAAEAAGLDPDKMTPELMEAFAREARNEPMEQVAKSRALTEVSDVPYTTGQQTQELSQLGREEAIRHGAYGAEAQGILRSFDDPQGQAMKAAVKAGQKRIGKGVTVEAEAGETMLEGLTRNLKELDDKIDDAYALARQSKATLKDPESTRGLIDSVTGALESFDLDPQLFPATTRAMNNLKKLLPKKGKKVMPIDIRKIELERRKLGNLIEAAANKADKKALVIVKRKYDEWLDEAVDNALFDGDQDALDLLKKARGLRREKGYLYEPRSRADDAGRVIQRMIERDPTPEQMINWTFGAGQIGGKGTAVQVAKRLKQIFPEGAPEWDALKEAGWLRLFQDKRGQMFSPTVIESNIKEALSKNGSLMRVLYSTDEIMLMEQTAMVLKQTVTPKQAMNPSQTAFSWMRVARDLIRRAGTGVTFRGHHFLGGGLFTVGRLLPIQATERAAAQAVKGMRKYGTRAPVGVAGGTAATQQIVED